MFKVNNNDTRTTPEQLLCSSVSIVNFEHVIAGWEMTLYLKSQALRFEHLSQTSWVEFTELVE